MNGDLRFSHYSQIVYIVHCLLPPRNLSFLDSETEDALS
jgi:hypothetical protein